MRAVVLVGGFGTRLRPLTLDRPKQMLPVVATTMFERVIGALGRHGVDTAVISLGYRPDALIDAYPDGRCSGVDLRYAVEPEPLDTAGAIGFAARHAGLDDTFLVVNGDVLTDLDYSWLVSEHRRRGGAATIHLIGVDDPSRYGVVVTDHDGRVERFVEKPEPGTAPSHSINAGTYVMEPSVVDLIPDGRRVSVERETFPLLCSRQALFAVQSDVYWIDAGTPGSYLRANLDLIDGTRGREVAVSPSAVVADDATVIDSVIGDRVRVDAGATVIRSVVMAGASIGSGVRVEESIVGGGSVVGSGAELADLSVVGFDAEVSTGSALVSATCPDSADWDV